MSQSMNQLDLRHASMLTTTSRLMMLRLITCATACARWFVSVRCQACRLMLSCADAAPVHNLQRLQINDPHGVVDAERQQHAIRAEAHVLHFSLARVEHSGRAVMMAMLVCSGSLLKVGSYYRP